MVTVKKLKKEFKLKTNLSSKWFLEKYIIPIETKGKKKHDFSEKHDEYLLKVR